MADFIQDNSDEIIVIGDKVDLVVTEGFVYRAMIEDRIDNGPFLVAIPSSKGASMQARIDDNIYLVFYRETGRYIAQMKVIGLERRGYVRYMWLLQKTAAQKNQRREAYRLPIGFNVQIFEYDEDDPVQDEPMVTQSRPGGPWTISGGDGARAVAIEKADSRDLSVTGIALITRKKYELENKHKLILRIGDTAGNSGAAGGRDSGEVTTHTMTATVKRCIPWRVSGRYDTGMQFINIDRNTSDELARFVLTQQQRQMKMRRLGR